MSSSLSDKQLQAIEKLSARESIGKSTPQLAQLCGISAPALRTWMKDPEFKKALDASYRVTLSNSSGQIDLTLLDLCLQGDLKAMRLYYEITGRIQQARDNQTQLNAFKFEIVMPEGMQLESAKPLPALQGGPIIDIDTSE